MATASGSPSMLWRCRLPFFTIWDRHMGMQCSQHWRRHTPAWVSACVHARRLLPIGKATMQQALSCLGTHAKASIRSNAHLHSNGRALIGAPVGAAVGTLAQQVPHLQITDGQLRTAHGIILQAGHSRLLHRQHLRACSSPPCEPPVTIQKIFCRCMAVHQDKQHMQGGVHGTKSIQASGTAPARRSSERRCPHAHRQSWVCPAALHARPARHWAACMGDNTDHSLPW